MKGEVLYSNHGLTVTVSTYALLFKYPFRLAHGSRKRTSAVFLTLREGEITAYGEAALPPYLGTEADQVIEFLRRLSFRQMVNLPLSEAAQQIDAVASGMHAAKTCADMALHDLHARRAGVSLRDFLNFPGKEPVHTTYTLGLSTPRELRVKLREADPFRMLKLKLGGPDDTERIKQFRQLTAKPFCADINQGWTDRTQAARTAEVLGAEGCIFIEQPFAPGREGDVQWLRERVPVPVIADESVRRYDEMMQVISVYDGVNIKLMKSAGIREAAAMTAELRRRGKTVVLGAMAESSCGATAAAHLAGEADYVDLDAPLLITNDPFSGITYRNGAVVLPEQPGTGVQLSDDTRSARTPH